MERIRGLTGRKQSYERIQADEDSGYGTPETRPLTLEDDEDEDEDVLAAEVRDAPEEPFEWVVYGVFFLLGIAMLWAWYVIHVQESGYSRSLMLVGTCSLQQGRIFRSASRRTIGC
jgi:hypothetical protein